MPKIIDLETFGKGRVFEVFSDIVNQEPKYRKYLSKITHFSEYISSLKNIPNKKQKIFLARILLMHYKKQLDQSQFPESYVNNIYHTLYRKFLEDNA